MADTQQIVETLVLCELAGATYGIPSRSVRQIELVEQLQPDVLTLDLMMPELDGVGFSPGWLRPCKR